MFRLSNRIFLLCLTLGIAVSSLVGLISVSQANSVSQAKQATPAAKPKPTSFLAGGNEPFWSISVRPNGIFYSNLDPTNISFPYVAPLAAQGRMEDVVRVYRLQRGKTAGQLIIRRGACGDTMSDRKYDYSATLILGNTVFEGCALKQ